MSIVDEINKLSDKYNKGERVSSVELTALYNKVFNKDKRVVTCATCLRKMLFELLNYEKRINKKN